MTRVGILLNFPKEYKGGINYLKNLFYALHDKKNASLEIYLFVSTDIEQEYIDLFQPYVRIVKTRLLKRKDPLWIFDKVCSKLFNYTPLAINLLRRYKIDIVSHSDFSSKFHPFGIVNWIPDFQWLHYPELWDTKAVNYLAEQTRKVLKHSSAVVVSSHDAKKDLLTFKEAAERNIQVLQFVSQPNHKKVGAAPELRKDIEEKYKFGGSFFYLPNQFWRHKNHLVAFKAIRILKEKGQNPLLITTGLMHDFRNNNDHIDNLLKYVKDHQLEDNIKFLGLIPYPHVLFLMENCLALINPSLFEGWSSTVEEAKSIGKLTILSDISVHKEQNPANALYFSPASEFELAEKMEYVWVNQQQVHIPEETQIQMDLHKRTNHFAERYQEIIADVMKMKAQP
jgi:glycosyltransferase involved in cell wall biosynthesis